MNSSGHMIGIFTTDSTLTITSWDEWLAQATGISQGAARGQLLIALVPDLAGRGILQRFERVLAEAVVEVLSATFHHYLFECTPSAPSKHFDRMQQRVTIAPLIDDRGIVGTIATVEDVTRLLDRERGLYEHLSSGNESERLKAVQTLAAQDTLETAIPLVDAARDESWRVRRSAVDGLARHGREDAVKLLLRTLREEHRNLSVLNSAIQVLALTGVDAVAPLADCLNDSDVDLRIYAAHALGEQHDRRAVPSLIRALEDPDANVRYHAIEALGKLRASEAVDQLVTVARSGDFYLAFPALDALTRIGDSRIAPELVPLLEDEMLRVPAADALGHLGDEETVAPLVALLNRPGAPVSTIAQSLAALYDRHERLYQEGNLVADLARSAVGATAAHNLLAALNETGDDELRALALVMGWVEDESLERALTRLIGKASARKEVVEALVRYGARVVDLLVEQLDSEELDVRQAAVTALGRIGDGRAVPALVRALDSDPELVIGAAGALANIGDRRAFDALLQFIGHPYAAVRQAVIAAINSIGHPDTPDRALTFLGDPDPYVRESAVKIAGYFGYSQCRELLLDRCSDGDESVRCAALQHIPYLEDDRILSILASALQNGTAQVRASAAQALAQIESPGALTFLLAALNDPDQWVRYFAARSIGRRAGAEAVDHLARLAQADPAVPVRIAAIDCLAQIGGARAVGTLAPLAESDDVDLAHAAIAGLGLVGHPDVLPPLLAALRSHDKARRMHALRALGARGGQDSVDAIKWVAAADGDPEVAQGAIDALARLAAPESIGTLINLASEPSLRDACVSALSQMGKEHIDAIGQGVAHTQTNVRRAIVEALGRMKQPQASDFLGVALEDSDAPVRLAAVDALAHLGNRSQERKLVAMARSDPDAAVRRAAQKALRR